MLFVVLLLLAPPTDACDRCNNLRVTLHCLETSSSYPLPQTAGLACEVVTGGITLECAVEGLLYNNNVTSFAFKSGKQDVSDYNTVSGTDGNQTAVTMTTRGDVTMATVIASVSADVVYLCEATVQDLNGDSHTLRSNSLIVKKVYQNSSELVVPSNFTSQNMSEADSYITELKCAYPTGWYPEPSFTWNKDGSPVEDSVRLFALEFDVGGYERGSLIIHGYNASDLGNYTCSIWYTDIGAGLEDVTNQTQVAKTAVVNRTALVGNGTQVNGTAVNGNGTQVNGSSLGEALNETLSRRQGFEGEETEEGNEASFGEVDEGDYNRENEVVSAILRRKKREESDEEEEEESDEEEEEESEEEASFEKNITVSWYNLVNGTVDAVSSNKFSYQVSTQEYETFTTWDDRVTISVYALGGFLGAVSSPSRASYSWSITGSELGMRLLNASCLEEVKENSTQGTRDADNSTNSTNSTGNSTSEPSIEDYYLYDMCLYWGSNTTQRTLPLSSGNMALLGITQEGPGGNTLSYEYTPGMDKSDIYVNITYSGGDDVVSVEDVYEGVNIVFGEVPPSDNNTCSYNGETPTLSLSEQFYSTFKSPLYQVLADYDLLSSAIAATDAWVVPISIDSVANKCLYYQIPRRNTRSGTLWSYLYQTVLVETLGDQGSSDNYTSTDYPAPTVEFISSEVHDKLRYVTCRASSSNNTSTLNWLELEPGCASFDLSPVLCSAPSIANSTLSPATLGIGVGSNYTVTCDSGYTMSGSATVVCEDGGNLTELPFCGSFTEVTTNLSISYDLEEVPLQIETASAVGSAALVNVSFYEADGAQIGYLAITFNNSGALGYHLEPCSEEEKFSSFSSSVTSTQDKIWEITKTSTNLTVACNSDVVLTYTFSDSSRAGCEVAFEKDVAGIMFDVSDTASIGYLVKPADSNVSDDCSYDTTLSFDMTSMSQPCNIVCMAKSQCSAYVSANTTVEPIFCSVPAVDHATFTIDDTAREALGEVLYTTSLKVSCDQGWQREGPDKIRCSSNGTFDGTVSCSNLTIGTCPTLDANFGTISCSAPCSCCTGTSGQVSCTYSCPDDTYFQDSSELLTNMTVTCNSSTAQWSHMSANNPTGALPSCAGLVTPTSYQLAGTVGFSGATSCISGTESALRVSLASSSSSGYDCLDNGKCSMAVSDISCAVNSNATGLELTFLVEQSSGDLTSSTVVDQFEAQLISDVSSSLGLSLSVSKRRRRGATLLTSDGSISTNASAQCEDGAGNVGTVCLACPAGQYEEGGVCSACPANTYSNSTGSTSCTTCPDSLETVTTGSDNLTDCTTLCEVAEIANGTRSPAEGYNVSTSTTVTNYCDSHFSIQQATLATAACSEAAPACYAKCTVTSVDERANFTSSAKTVTTDTELRYQEYVNYTCTNTPGENYSVYCSTAGLAYSVSCPTSYVGLIVGILVTLVVLAAGAVGVYKVIEYRNRPVYKPPIPERVPIPEVPPHLPIVGESTNLLDRFLDLFESPDLVESVELPKTKSPKTTPPNIPLPEIPPPEMPPPEIPPPELPLPNIPIPAIPVLRTPRKASQYSLQDSTLPEVGVPEQKESVYSLQTAVLPDTPQSEAEIQEGPSPTKQESVDPPSTREESVNPASAKEESVDPPSAREGSTVNERSPDAIQNTAPPLEAPGQVQSRDQLQDTVADLAHNTVADLENADTNV